MNLDPTTLLACLAMICTAAALGFSAGARFCALSPSAARHWALANALFALGTVLTIVRADVASPTLFALADACELAGFALLRAGFYVFIKRERRLPWRLALIALAGVALWQAYAEGHTTLRLLGYCAIAAVELGLAACVAFQGLRGEFGAGYASWMAAPMALACGLQLLRAAMALAPQSHAEESLSPTAVNVALDLAGLVVALGLNTAVAVFIGARQVARIHALTRVDPLTGALNRRALDDVLAHELLSLSRHRQPLSLLYLDLHRFKAINDEHGHACGDAALRHLTAVLQRECRRADAVARVGGDEFCVVLPYTCAAGASRVIERLRAVLQAMPLEWESRSLVLAANVGATTIREGDACSPAELLDRADRAMYEGKRGQGPARPANDAPPLGIAA